MDRANHQAPKSADSVSLAVPLVVAALLAAITMLISTADFRVNDASVQPVVTFPPATPSDLQVWQAKSQKDNTEITEDGLAIWTGKPEIAAISARLPWDANQHKGNAYVLVKASVEVIDKTYTDTIEKQRPNRRSLLIVRPTTGDRKERLRNYMFKRLSMADSTQSWNTVNHIDNRTDTINVHLLLRAPGAWSLNSLEVSSFSLSLTYLVTLTIVLLAWALVFGVIVRRLVAGRHWWLQVVGLVSVIGIGLGAGLSGSAIGFLGAYLAPLTQFMSGDQLWHVLGHFILSIGVLLMTRLSLRSLVNVIAINIVTALFIESLQAHLPYRSTSLEDIAYGMTGALAATALVLFIWLVRALVCKALIGKKARKIKGMTPGVKPRLANIDIEL